MYILLMLFILSGSLLFVGFVVRFMMVRMVVVLLDVIFRISMVCFLLFRVGVVVGICVCVFVCFVFVCIDSFVVRMIVDEN